MAHFARLDSNNVVTEVVVVANSECLDDAGMESEEVGVKFCVDLFGGAWKQTSYNGSIRKNFAAIGFTYDSARDAFIGPKPYPSWVLVEETCRWIAPLPYPEDGAKYAWDEVTTSWAVVNQDINV